MKKKPDDISVQWDQAQAALEAARKLPGGEERIEALKKAGRMRFDADLRRRKEEGRSRVKD